METYLSLPWTRLLTGAPQIVELPGWHLLSGTTDSAGVISIVCGRYLSSVDWGFSPKVHLACGSQDGADLERDANSHRCQAGGYRNKIRTFDFTLPYRIFRARCCDELDQFAALAELRLEEKLLLFSGEFNLAAMSASLPGNRDLPSSQYDLKTYWGRVRHSIDLSDPR